MDNMTKFQTKITKNLRGDKILVIILIKIAKTSENDKNWSKRWKRPLRCAKLNTLGWLTWIWGTISVSAKSRQVLTPKSDFMIVFESKILYFGVRKRRLLCASRTFSRIVLKIFERNQNHEIREKKLYKIGLTCYFDPGPPPPYTLNWKIMDIFLIWKKFRQFYKSLHEDTR